MLNSNRKKTILICVGILVVLGYFFSPSRSDLSCSNKYLLDQAKLHIVNNMDVYYFALEGTGFLERNALGYDLIEKLPGIVNDMDAAGDDKIEDPYLNIILFDPNISDVNVIDYTSSGFSDVTSYCQANLRKCPSILNSSGTGFSQELLHQLQEYKNKILNSFTGVLFSSIITVGIDHDTKSISCQAKFTLVFDGADGVNPQLISYHAQLDSNGDWLFDSQFGS